MDFIQGKVIQGKKLARRLGFPTINIEICEDIAFSYGIYAGILEYRNKEYQGVISWGYTPTDKVDLPKFEMHIFNFNKEIYGEEVKIYPKFYIRKEMLFTSHQELIAQINNDCERAKKYFNSHA